MDLEIDENLLNHLGFLFARDALVIYKDRIEKIDENSTEHFEVIFLYFYLFKIIIIIKNIQSTNWNSVRFKPQPNLQSNYPW